MAIFSHFMQNITHSSELYSIINHSMLSTFKMAVER